MVKVIVNGQEFYLDAILQTNLDLIKKKIKDDWDFVYVVDGKEGTGKSVFAQQIGYYLSDGTLSVDHIVFTPEDFKTAVLNAPKYSCVIFDEAFRGLSVRQALSQTNRTLTSMMQEIRQKNLFILIVLPSIWDLDKHIALHRCKGIFHVSTDKQLQRGFFKFYGSDYLMVHLKDYKNKYTYPKYADFRGRFVKFVPVDNDAYLEKKHKSLGDLTYKKTPNGEISSYRDRIGRDRIIVELIDKVKDHSGNSFKEICDEIGMNAATYREIKRRLNAKEGINVKNEEFSGETKEEFT